MSTYTIQYTNKQGKILQAHVVAETGKKACESVLKYSKEGTTPFCRESIVLFFETNGALACNL